MHNRICLDKTVRLTREIMNGNVELPEYIKVEKILGAMSSFRFGNSKVSLPIEHIGLGYLASEAARREFSMKVKGSTGEYTTFELVRQEEGSYIANFLKAVCPDVLNWYQNAAGEQMKMEYVGSTVLRDHLNRYVPCKTVDEQGVDLRELTLQEAYKSALGEYVETYLDYTEAANNPVVQEGVVDFVNNDTAVFNQNLEALKVQSLATISQSQGQGE